MNFVFLSSIPAEIEKEAVLISGSKSALFDGIEYLVIKENDVKQKAFQIRFEYHCSPFKQAVNPKNLLAVGHEGHFSLYDLLIQTNLLTLEMDRYFGHLYINDDLFYITSVGSVYCIDETGNLIWKNSAVGIDGVLNEKFTDTRIYGSGEWDPPGSWKNFALDLKTGRFINENNK